MIGMDAARPSGYPVPLLDELIQTAELNTIVADHAAAEFLRRRFELELAGAPTGSFGRTYRVIGTGRPGVEIGWTGAQPVRGTGARSESAAEPPRLERRLDVGRSSESWASRVSASRVCCTSSGSASPKAA